MRTNLLVVVGAAALLAAAGIALSQDKSSPNTKSEAASPPAAQPAASKENAKTTADHPVIGYLEKRNRTITIKAGPKGPLYSVKTADGKVLCENLSKEQLTAQVPELANFLKTAVASAPGAKIDARVRVTAEAMGR